MEHRPDRDVRVFGLAFFVVCGGFGAWQLMAGRIGPGAALAALALYFAAGAALRPRVLRPPFWVWMRFAFTLGWINSRILLGLFYYLVITPYGLLSRAFVGDPMDRKSHRGAESYWKMRAPAEEDPSRYERQF